MHLLKTEWKFLDFGLCLPLQSIAIAKGGSDAAVDFLQSEPIQDFLMELFSYAAKSRRCPPSAYLIA